MNEIIVALPFSFWMVIALLVGGAVWAGGKIRGGLGLPMLAVLGTTAVWYLGDVFYNDYAGYVQTFSFDTLQNAWWQVTLFLFMFLIATPAVHELMNAGYQEKVSSVQRIWRAGVNDPSLQRSLTALGRGSMVTWVVLALIAALRLGDEIPYYVFPFLSHKADPWGRGRLGSGIDAILSAAGYAQLFASASFGVVAALAKNSRVRSAAILGCVLAWPFFIFDRTRNVMLSAVLPGILAWSVLRLRGWLYKGVALVGCFLLIFAWFGFVLANRDEMRITDALHEKGFSLSGGASVHHDGLNMYEELCWINDLIGSGAYQPNWGTRYFSEIVNFVPRAIWKDKPLVGIDYAIARGFSFSQGEAGVGATISTGMIGQGIVNFGRILGPLFSALLMSIWAAVLARLDLRGDQTTLFGLGLTLTFNLGRDITLLTLYTFCFGALVVWLMNSLARKNSRAHTLRTIKRVAHADGFAEAHCRADSRSGPASRP